jgi:hypothetical protein
LKPDTSEEATVAPLFSCLCFVESREKERRIGEV